MTDPKNRSAFIPTLVVGAILFGLALFLFTAPMKACPACPSYWAEQLRFHSPPRQPGFPVCPVCEDEGKVSPLGLWNGEREEES